MEGFLFTIWGCFCWALFYGLMEDQCWDEFPAGITALLVFGAGVAWYAN